MRIAIPINVEDGIMGINSAYISYVAAAGFEPILVTPENDLITIANLCGGLLLPGGKDVDPIFYGSSNFSSVGTDPDKDEFERRLLRTFLGSAKPIFGICRGFQLIALEYIRDFGNKDTKWPGSNLRNVMRYSQHIEYHACTTSLKLKRTIPHHRVSARADVLYGKHDGYKDEGVYILSVNSMHHQGLLIDAEAHELAENNMITDNLSALAWTERGANMFDEDEEDILPTVVCEALKIDNWTGSRVIAVQWHPEELNDVGLIRNCFGRQGGKKPARSKSRKKANV
jgi:gamma-glutamyl-gamma-aminobutyrate hydrolase PuuD